ncbi:hypothetical protein CGUA_10960 [Corynebacterium guangdongense]|uniref:Uncharacterized protein n=1 Tax=Corynebacterium guangdongense TaxID=1783348 RepID=A0ABU1ZZ18_9CORY|nr:hypothetical protein [Corynebacterium guangdongense]WJZ18739.1 hypothetical protein CGUA_10960 [Corynebacterium guangdongense]
MPLRGDWRGGPGDGNAWPESHRGGRRTGRGPEGSRRRGREQPRANGPAESLTRNVAEEVPPSARPLAHIHDVTDPDAGDESGTERKPDGPASTGMTGALRDKERIGTTLSFHPSTPSPATQGPIGPHGDARPLVLAHRGPRAPPLSGAETTRASPLTGVASRTRGQHTTEWPPRKQSGGRPPPDIEGHPQHVRPGTVAHPGGTAVSGEIPAAPP